MHFIVRRQTRECVIARHRCTIVHRVGPRRVEIAVHQRAEYFQRGR
jgi:hypothetical protein